MYLCLAEATKAIVSAVKPVSNKDKTHTGQFEYSVWMELVRDSAEITMRHGLYAQPKKEMKTLVGELNNFHLLWTAPTKATKDKVKTHVRDMFSPKAKLLTTIGHRSLGQFSLYEDRKWPISGIQMVIHAYKVKQEKKNKHDCILTGGKYLPFDDVADDIRDTIHFKQDGCPHPVKAEHFHDLSLNSDSELLNPQVLATAIYIDKSITDDERGKARKLRGRYLSWKAAQKKKNPAYVKIIHFKEADICDSGGGGGGERNKRITKGELIKPMEDLAGQFCELHDYIDDENARAKDYLTGTMTDTFNRIAEIVNVHTQPVYDLETDSDESEPDDDGSSDSSEEGKGGGEGEREGEGEEEGGGGEEKKKKGKMKKKTNKKEKKEKAKKKTTKTTKKTHDEDENEGDDVEDATTQGGTGEDNESEKDGDDTENQEDKGANDETGNEDDADGDDTDNEDDEGANDETRNEEHPEDGKGLRKKGEGKEEGGEEKGDGQAQTLNQLPDFSTLESCSRNDIINFVTELSAKEECDIESVKANNKEMVQWLRLSRAPKKNQMDFFCLFQTSHKNKIVSRYFQTDDDELSDNNDTWITHLVSFLKRINEFHWCNSFDHLPQNGKDKQDFFLLWLGNETFEKNFYTQRKRSPRRAANSSIV